MARSDAVLAPGRRDQLIETDQPLVPFGRFGHLAPAVFRTSRDYVRRQWSRSQVTRLQTTRLTDCLRGAIRNVPEYRALDVDVDLAGANPWEALERFPPVAKADVRDRLEDFVADDFDPRRCFRVSTSGSTGVPLVVVQDETSLLHECSSFFRLLECAGFEVGDRAARVVSDRSRPMWRVETHFLAGVMELAVANLLEPDQTWSRRTVLHLEEWEPKSLTGNPSDLVALALLCRRFGVRLPAVSFVVASGENLERRARALIEETFTCRVHEIYSLQEARYVAWECEAGSLHINQDRVVVESLVGPSGCSEIAITTLLNRTMPLIRYRTADLGRVLKWEDDPCSCGRKLDRIVEFLGRDRGFVVLTNDRLYSPKPIKLLLTEQPVLSWRMVQTIPAKLEVFVVPDESVDVESLTESIRKEVVHLTEGQLEVGVTAISPDELLRSGGSRKFQMMELHAYRESIAGN